MRFNGFTNHYQYEGLHAPYSPSQSSWLRYDDEKIVEVHINKKAKEMGTKYHQWAQDTINLRIKQPKSKKTLYSYVNDAIGFDMKTEVVLYYSDRFFGTADAICFSKGPEGRYLLRIHDLKTGKIPADMEQLYVYAALFCLEYHVKPGEIDFELRIYQNDQVFVDNPTAEDILPVMDRIVHLDKVVEKFESKEA